jgi:hypothetical protein
MPVRVFAELLQRLNPLFGAADPTYSVSTLEDALFEGAGISTDGVLPESTSEFEVGASNRCRRTAKRCAQHRVGSGGLEGKRDLALPET